MAAPKKIKITFTKSPTGKFGLAYDAGNTVPVEAKLANEIIKAGYATPADGKKQEE